MQFKITDQAEHVNMFDFIANIQKFSFGCTVITN